MAGDWIKMRTDLPDDPAVISMSSRLRLCEDTIVGKLHRLWSWADRHTADGRVPGIGAPWVDKFVGAKGFASAMESVGWLLCGDGYIEFPAFDNHNGESAKRRAENTLRARKSRGHRDASKSAEQKSVTQPSHNLRDKSASTGQNRTEQDRREETKVNLRSDQSINPTSSQPSDKAPVSDQSDRKEIKPTEDEIAERSHYAAELFKLAGYGGSDGEIFWRVAMLIGRGVSQQWAVSAANGAGINGKSNRPGWFRCALIETCEKNGVDLKAELARVKLPKGKYTAAPEPQSLGFAPRAP